MENHLTAGGRVEFDLGVLERTRLELIGASDVNERARRIVLGYAHDHDPDGVKLRAAAGRIVESVPTDAVLSMEARAILAECPAVLDGKRLPDVLERFADGCPRVVSTGRGWHRIIIELDRQIAEAAPDARYAQIKGEFGGLRVYVDDGSERVEALTS